MWWPRMSRLSSGHLAARLLSAWTNEKEALLPSQKTPAPENRAGEFASGREVMPRRLRFLPCGRVFAVGAPACVVARDPATVT